MVDRELILQKLQQLTTYLAELEPIARFPFAQYLENYFTRYTAERLLQLIVDTAADINAHLLVDRTNIPPKDYRDSFLRLADLGLLPRDFAEQIAKSAGLRNILVHQYEVIDHRLVYASIAEALAQYPVYARSIMEFVEAQAE